MEGREKGERRARRVALMGMLFALAVALSVLEGAIPPPIPVPGVRFGLSNIVVMYALFFLRMRDAIVIALLKGLFAALTRGASAGLLSLSGGFASILVMAFFYRVFRGRSYFFYSMAGALAHNLGQFAAIRVMYGGVGVWYYLPVLIVAGAVAGMVTAVLLKCVLPVLSRFL